MTRKEMEIERNCERIERNIVSLFRMEETETGKSLSSIQAESKEIRLDGFETKEKQKKLAILNDVFFQVLKDMDVSTMVKRFKASELANIAENFNVRKSGKKSEIASLIKKQIGELEYSTYQYNESLADADFFLYPLFDGDWFYARNGQIDLISKEEAINLTVEYIAKNELHKQFAIAVVQSTARSQSGRQGKIACEQIVKSGYREEIFEDITMDIYIQLHTLIKETDNIWIVRNKLTFAHGAFGSLYGAMYQTLVDFKNPSVGTGIEIPVEFMTADNETVTLYYNESNAVSTLSKAVTVDSLINCETVRQFVRFVYRMDAKHADNVIKVLYAIFATGSDKMTALSRYLGVNRKTATTWFATLKAISYQFNYGELRDSESWIDGGCTYRKSDSSASGSYGFQYGYEIPRFDRQEITQDAFEEYLERNRYFYNIPSATATDNEKPSGCNTVQSWIKACDKHIPYTVTTNIRTGKKEVPEYISNSKWFGENIAKRMMKK